MSGAMRAGDRLARHARQNLKNAIAQRTTQSLDGGLQVNRRRRRRDRCGRRRRSSWRPRQRRLRRRARLQRWNANDALACRASDLTSGHRRIDLKCPRTMRATELHRGHQKSLFGSGIQAAWQIHSYNSYRSIHPTSPTTAESKNSNDIGLDSAGAKADRSRQMARRGRTPARLARWTVGRVPVGLREPIAALDT